jgi:hypothetical protein
LASRSSERASAGHGATITGSAGNANPAAEWLDYAGVAPAERVSRLQALIESALAWERRLRLEGLLAGAPLQDLRIWPEVITLGAEEFPPEGRRVRCDPAANGRGPPERAGCPAVPPNGAGEHLAGVESLAETLSIAERVKTPA